MSEARKYESGGAAGDTPLMETVMVNLTVNGGASAPAPGRASPSVFGSPPASRPVRLWEFCGNNR